MHRRKMGSLYLSIADRMLPESARLAQFGDASERLVDFQKHHVVISAHTKQFYPWYVIFNAVCSLFAKLFGCCACCSYYRWRPCRMLGSGGTE